MKPKQHVSLAKAALWVFVAMLAGASIVGIIGGLLVLSVLLFGGVIGPVVWLFLLIFIIGTAIAYGVANADDSDGQS